jgi:uncharacterized membrane protein YebE (DUF533 family)
MQNLLSQFLGSSGQPSSAAQTENNGIGGTLSNLTSQIPGGLVGGAAAGGIMALLMGNKSARKIAGKAATYGGAAMLGGLAFKAFQNYRQNNQVQNQPVPEKTAGSSTPTNFHQQAIAHSDDSQTRFELTLMKAMIASARADGHIDADEQQKIFKAVEDMALSSEEKGMVFDWLQSDISVQEIASSVSSPELRSEIYLASCLVINPDQASERAHLNQLSSALELPQELTQELEWQANQVYTRAA